MCCDTKARIAATVRELMQKRPVSKITVQDVMERADMTRQSFYYHFQDIYDVLEWDVNQNLNAQLIFRHDQTFEAWCQMALILMRDNQPFCRKIAEALGRNKLQAMMRPFARPQMERLLFEGSHNELLLTEEEEYVLDFASQTLVDNFLNILFNSARIDVNDSMRKIRAVIHILQRKGDRPVPAPHPRPLAC